MVNFFKMANFFHGQRTSQTAKCFETEHEMANRATLGAAGNRRLSTTTQSL